MSLSSTLARHNVLVIGFLLSEAETLFSFIFRIVFVVITRVYANMLPSQSLITTGHKPKMENDEPMAEVGSWWF